MVITKTFFEIVKDRDGLTLGLTTHDMSTSLSGSPLLYGICQRVLEPWVLAHIGQWVSILLGTKLIRPVTNSIDILG